MRDIQYRFDFDWFTVHAATFQRFLFPLSNSPCSLLEIGSHEGRSATWLADNLLQHKDASLDCIDLKLQDRFRQNISLTGRSTQIRLHEGPSRSILRTLPECSFDFIYVDGSHATADVLEDAVLSFQNLKKGGILAFDDYLWDDPRYNQGGTPKAAIDSFLTIFSSKLTTLLQAHQVWVRKISA